MENKLFLLNLLKLSSDILENNDEAITVAKELNENQLDENQQIQIKQSFDSLTKQNLKDSTILREVIKCFGTLNQIYLISLIELREIDFQDKERMKAIIIEKLTDTTIRFDDAKDKYNYYTLLVNLTIASRDVELIKLAIDKIQNM